MTITHDHEMVSIYPFADDEIDRLMAASNECVLMWATRDGWPVGVIHAFVWREGRIWLTFAAHRHRAAAIRRDPRVSVTVSSAGYAPGAAADLPQGGVTFKGRAEFFDDAATKAWFYSALSAKVHPDSPDEQAAFFDLLDSPLRTVLAVTPVKKIMYNGAIAARHMAGTVDESELGARMSSDAERMNRERTRRGLDPR